MEKKTFLTWVLFFLVALFFFFPRLYNIDKRFGFDWDQEKISYEVKNILVHHKFTLIGPRANNDRGFFLGPHLAYSLLPFYLATNLHPSALMYFVITYCVLFFFCAYFIIKKIFNNEAVIVFLLMWAANLALILADIGPVWPILMPLGVITNWYILYSLYHDERPFWWFLLGINLGFFFNMHFQYIFIAFFSTSFLLISKSEIKPNIKKLSYFFGGIFLMFLPLVLFDIRHNFFNVNLFYHFFTDKDPNVGHWAAAWIPVFSNVSYPLLFLRGSFMPGLLLYALVLIMLIFQSRSKKGYLMYFYYASTLLWLIFPLFFSLYGKRPSEYYFVFLYPFMIITFVDFFLAKKRYYPLLILFSAYTIFNCVTIIPVLSDFGLNFAEKDKAVKRIAEVLGKKKCDIAFNVPLGREVGYKYLFEYYGIKTIGDWKSCVVNINIPPREGDESFGYLGVTFPKNIKK